MGHVMIQTYGIVLSEEGEYTLKYIAYNAKGIPSENKEEVYKIEFKAPDAPKTHRIPGNMKRQQKFELQCRVAVLLIMHLMIL